MGQKTGPFFRTFYVGFSGPLILYLFRVFTPIRYLFPSRSAYISPNGWLNVSAFISRSLENSARLNRVRALASPHDPSAFVRSRTVNMIPSVPILVQRSYSYNIFLASNILRVTVRHCLVGKTNKRKKKQINIQAGSRRLGRIQLAILRPIQPRQEGAMKRRAV